MHTLAFPNQRATLKTESQSAREVIPQNLNQLSKKHGGTRKERKDFLMTAKAECF